MPTLKQEVANLIAGLPINGDSKCKVEMLQQIFEKLNSKPDFSGEFAHLSNYSNSIDITKEGSTLVLTERTKTTQNILGYTRLRDSFIWNTSSLSSKINRKLEIIHSHDLNGETVTLPENVTLEFNGGSLYNGTIVGNNTRVKADALEVLNCDITGTWNVDVAKVEWFGAKGDGVNDDSIAAIRAYNMQKSTGGIVHFGVGNFKMESRVDIVDSNITFKGLGRSLSNLVGKTSSEYFKIGSTTSGNIENVTFQNFSIEHNNCSGIWIGGQTINNIDNITFRNLKMRSTGDGRKSIFWATMTGQSSGFRVLDCDIENSGLNSYGIQCIEPIKSVWIERNRVALTNANNLLSNTLGSYNNISLYGDTRDFHVNNNHCFSGGHSPIAISPAGKGEIMGNHVYDVYSVNEAGIEIEWKNSHLGTSTSENVIVKGNQTFNCYWGIVINRRDTDQPSPSEIIVTENIMKDSIYAGGYIKDGKNIIFNNNVIANSVSTGIRLANDVQNVSVSGNTITNSGGKAIWVDDLTTGGEVLKINGNIIDGCAEGIKGNGMSYSSVSQNIIKNATSRAIEFVGVGSINNSNISNNIIRNGGDKGIWLGSNSSNNKGSNNIIDSIGVNIDDEGTGNTVS